MTTSLSSPLQARPALVLLLILSMFMPQVSAAEPAINAPNTLTKSERDAGWKLLFDGTSLTGWRPYGKKAHPGKGWKVEHGILKKITKVNGGNIITERTFNDFELRWEWRIARSGNNGIKYLVTEKRRSAPGHEYQLLDDEGHPDGKVGAKRQAAAFYDVLPPNNKKRLKPVGEWNQSRIRVQGSQVEHWLNGAKVLEYQLGSETLKKALANSKFKNAAAFGTKIKGHIMITDHTDECWFRNIKLLELPAK